MEAATPKIRIPRRVFKVIQARNDGIPEQKSSQSLVYTSDNSEGIRRIRKGKGFQYEFQGQPLKDKADLKRIRQLVLPPAWEDVWICTHSNGHLQATGVDLKKRKQYRYHTLWMMYRGQTKFDRLLEFGEKLPPLRTQLQKDLAQSDMPKSKVLAAIVAIMEQTTIRIGSVFYEKLYGSFGLSTLQNRHVQIQGNQLRFKFKGKKGIYHDISMKSRKLAKLIQRCKHIPGKELFQYVEKDDTIHNIESGDVNLYIQELCQSQFSSKDFRTWAGSVECIAAFREITLSGDTTKKDINSALDRVASHLGNSRNVCKKYYVHPSILEWVENDRLIDLINHTDNTPDSWVGLNDNEILLMRLLTKCQNC